MTIQQPLPNGTQRRSWWLSAGVQVPFIFTVLSAIVVGIWSLGSFSEEFAARGLRIAELERKVATLQQDYVAGLLTMAGHQSAIDELQRLLLRIEALLDRHVDGK